jgi:hypothetical protein
MIFVEEDPDQHWTIFGEEDAEEVEKEEDFIRRSKRKTIRYGGKHKGRGKEKPKEP